MRIYEILPGQLYQSRTTVGLPWDDVKASLDKFGITAVYNLWNVPDPRVEHYVVDYTYASLPDGKYPDLDMYAKLAYDAILLINVGNVVLVHCHGGVNRSGLLNAIILMFMTGVDGSTAMKTILERRPGSFANKEFRVILDSLYVEAQ